MDTKEKIKKFRLLMKDQKIDAYLILTGDPHQSEYIPEYYKTIKWLTGFSGSAGTLVITKDHLVLWTDGRYYTQAEKQLANTGGQVIKMDQPGAPSYTEWLNSNMKQGDVLAFDGRIISQKDFEDLEKDLNFGPIIKKDLDLFEDIWDTRPDFPADEAFVHHIKYAGISAREKIQEIRSTMEAKGVDYHIIAKLDDIAWLYNIRGSDIPSNPMIISYGLITKDRAYLYTHESKIIAQVRDHLDENGIQVHPYERIKDHISEIQDGQILVDKSSINAWLYEAIDSSLEITDEMNPSFVKKAVKTDHEIENIKNAFLKDGIALTRFLYWLEDTLANQPISEYEASQMLYKFRAQMSGFKSTSFETIMAFRENAAMMHYRPSQDEAKIIEKDGMVLIDSGGQYLDGTTDTTRTIPVGHPTKEEKIDYTLTLKSHISLIIQRFLYGTSGHVLDAIARKPMWDLAMDYKSGTGHGIGYFLNVHEGPHRFHNVIANNVGLEENMLITIEPGVYRPGQYGIRIENVGLVKKDIETEFGLFMKFEPISFVYIDTSLVVKDILDDSQIDWLNAYNAEVYDKISSHLDEDQKLWLKDKTRPI